MQVVNIISSEINNNKFFKYKRVEISEEEKKMMMMVIYYGVALGGKG